MQANIVLLPGDGVGPEVTAEAARVLNTVAELGGHRFQLDSHPMGGNAIDDFRNPLPPGTLAACKDADAVLLGAVGGPKWSDPAAELRPEQGLLDLRAELGLFANLRPVPVFETSRDAASRTRSALSSARRCCSATASVWRPRRPRSKPRSPRSWTTGSALPIWRPKGSRQYPQRRWAWRSPPGSAVPEPAGVPLTLQARARYKLRRRSARCNGLVARLRLSLPARPPVPFRLPQVAGTARPSLRRRRRAGPSSVPPHGVTRRIP